MPQQYMNENSNRNGRAAAKLKKAGKILGITFLCIIAFIVVSFGILIYKGMHPAKSSTTSNQISVDNPTVISTDSSEEVSNEYIDTPIYNEFQIYAANSSGLPVALSDSDYASIMESLSGEESEFRMSKYYALDQTLNM